MQVRFWGVRGSIPVCSDATRRVGGNTSCVEVQYGGSHLVLDGGTGLRALGESLGHRPLDLTLVFSHVHWDHIQGFPFFLPAFHPDTRLTLVGQPNLRAALMAQMRPPTFPLRLDQVPARLDFRELTPRAPLEVGPFVLRASPLKHPDPVQAIRVEAGGRRVLYATDHEHGVSLDGSLIDFAGGVNLLIHDAQFTDAEYSSRRGWGHSTWQQAVAIAEHAGVSQLALFHHDPGRRDAEVDQIEAIAQQQRSGIFAARQGMELLL